ncbi:protein of unknown function [Sulfitobacter brevis]|uniref:YjiS-like domain-containing protein n=1 Tax=Sulfitobacter brevis TaxID=74348 RepID=A0A1I1Z6X7_9RHOB|nr:DUF1127 domain-containing protein [Sulfitobacter brevis]SFE27546.1 protein of unknown function [Sulfitobacter brevis]
MAYVNTTSATTPSFFARIGTAFDAMATRYKQHRMYRQTFDGLSALSNRELADLGLNRSELRFVAWESSRSQAD